MQIETVKIEAGDSYTVINKDEFDPAVHKLYEPVKPVSDQPSGESDQSQDQLPDPSTTKPKTDRKPKQ